MKQIKPLLKLIGVVLVALVMSACGKPQKIFTDGNDIFGRAFPIKLQGDTTELFLVDILLPEALEKSIELRAHKAFNVEYYNDEKKALIIAKTANVPYLSELQIIVDDAVYSIIMERSRRQNYTFMFDPDGKCYRSVAIAGELNDWNPGETPLTLIDGV